MKFFSLVFMFVCLQSAFAASYKVDPDHSYMGFKVRHLMIADVHGNFKEFEGTFDFDEKKKTISNTNFTIQTKSVNTNVEKRDNHLRTADFFDVEKYPVMTFKNGKVTKNKKNKYELKGDFTLLGVTKPVTFQVTFNGSKQDMESKKKAGFTATTKINRKDYGMKFNAPAYGGGVLVSEEVEIHLDVEAFEQPAQ